jgi:uncharacterized protein (UPF0332 family)
VRDLSAVDLAKYRLEKSGGMLASAKRDLAAGDYASANNRAYYCIFHAMRAVLALDNVDFKKHSAVISTFSQQYLKTMRFDRSYGTLITTASLIRTRSDYEDFYVCGVGDTQQLIQGAEQFHGAVAQYLQTAFSE